jgi:hypothetical protein
MKRFSRDMRIHESRMWKKPALDLKAPVESEEREEEEVCTPEKKKFDRRGARLYTMDSLPSTMFHLGEDNFVSIVYFLGQTRIHIRRYVTDEDGFLHPTKDGVSLSTKVWHSFQQKIASFQFADQQLLVIEKDLCVSCEKKDDGESIFVFQRMFPE